MKTTVYKNPYIRECNSSTFSVLFNRYCRKKINLLHVLLQYPEWHPKVDIFQYIENLNMLRETDNTYFVFDASTEGFSPFKSFFFDILYNNCVMYNIDPSKVIFVSTNMKDYQNIKTYNKRNKIQRSIRVFCFLSFRKMILDMVEDTYGLNFDSDKAFRYFYKKTHENFANSYGLSLSRVNRDHRIMAHYLLWETELQNYFAISQNTIEIPHANSVVHKYDLDSKKFSEWTKTLPAIIDTADFDTNHALTMSSDLHTQSLFQIVNETHVDSWHGESLFYSEKTFRSIAHMQPFVIFGQTGCNHALEKYGYKLYHELFDYSFDYIHDTKERYLALLRSISKAVESLNSMSHTQQISWRFSQETTLKHNFDQLMNIHADKNQFKKLVDNL